MLKKYTHTIIIGVSAAFLLSACQNSTTSPISKTPTQTTEQSSISIEISDEPIAATSGQIKEETSTLIIDAVYPITGNSAVDQALKQLVEENIANFKKEAPEIAPQSNYSQNSLYITFTRTKLFNQDNYQSFKFDISVYTGGAHPNTTSHTLTFRMSDGQTIELADLFTPESNFLKTLSNLSRESLKTQLEDSDLSMLEAGTEPGEDNFHSWSLDNDRLLLHFDPYQVAPYAAGPQVVSIKLADLGNLLRPEFQKAPAPSIPEKITPSRAASDGCNWGEFKDALPLGLKMLVENCPDGPFVVVRKGKIASHNEKIKIGLDALSDDKFNNLIEIFSKPINQTPEEAIKNQFINQLSPEEKTACSVQSAPEYSNGISRAYIITASPEYLKKLGDGDSYPEKICGGYDQTNGIGYFEFQDFNAEKFIFIRLGDLRAPFDEKNLYILPSSPTNTTVTDQQLSIKDL